MNEHGYVRAINSRISKSVYQLKINLRFRRDVADSYYSGPGGDLWVEYKWLAKTPVNYFTPDLRPGQRRWLNDRYSEGRCVAVIVGTPDGGMILTNGAWNKKQQSPEQWLSHAEVVKWIEQTTLSTST